MQIRKATLADFDSFFNIILACKEDMKAKGAEQWPSHHPSKERVLDGIKKGEHFVALQNNAIVGGVRLNHTPDDQYALVKWGIKDEKPLIVHQLAVDPKLQGKGIAKELMAFAEEYAKKEGSKSVRLDTYSKNTPSNNFYKKLGYEFVGTIMMPQYMPGKYNCYEKMI
ncbi:MAG: GNAT family N-acetyltransferase [archaeon]